MTTSQKVDSAVINGIETKRLQQIVETVKGNPAIAQTTFFSTTTWKRGFNNETAIKDFEMGKNKVSRPQTFRVIGDHPPELLGTNGGPFYPELLLAALGHNLASGWSKYGALLAVPIDELKVQVDGDIDLQGMLMLPQPGAVRPGYQEIRAKYYVKSRASRSQLEQVKKMAEDLSAIRDSLRAVRFISELVIES
ncbi:MAG: OsmC family protein [Nitrososphaera sp.]